MELFMPSVFLSTAEIGGYISVVKLVCFLVLFFVWLPILGWVYTDAQQVRIKEKFWTAIVFSVAIFIILWLLIPVFVVGLLLYIIALGVLSISYIMFRNSKVSAFERVLTADHFKSLFVNEEKKAESAGKGMNFVTANGNEVPVPKYKSSDYLGYKEATDIFTEALLKRAADIVAIPAKNDYATSFIIDGVVARHPVIEREQMMFLIRFLKQLADLDVKEMRKPQRGIFEVTLDKDTTQWEVTTSGSTAGEQLRLRKVEEQNILRIDEVGLTANQLAQIQEISDAGPGLFIVSGPPKSGSTTTFYAMLKNHDPFMYDINTLECQITAELPNVTQNLFSLSDTGTTTFGKRLRTAYRTGADVIGASHCPDNETADVICFAVNEGKRLYAEIEAAGVLDALGKWIKLVGDKAKAINVLLGISNQRILRKLCDKCRQAYKPNNDLLRKFNIPADKAKVFYRPGKVLYDKHGKERICDKCQGSGFYGRTCVFEEIIFTDELKQAVIKSQNAPEISAHFRKVKMLFMQEQALRKAIEGVTSIDEVIRAFAADRKKKNP